MLQCQPRITILGLRFHDDQEAILDELRSSNTCCLWRRIDHAHERISADSCRSGTVDRLGRGVSEEDEFRSHVPGRTPR